MDAAIALAAEVKPDVKQADAPDCVLERLSAPQEVDVVRIFNHLDSLAAVFRRKTPGKSVRPCIAMTRNA
jgi:hypothetical protein